MKFWITCASGGEPPVGEQEGYYSMYFAPGSGHEHVEPAYYVVLNTLEEVLDLIKRTGHSVVIGPSLLDQAPGTTDEYRPYGVEAEWHITIYDDNLE